MGYVMFSLNKKSRLIAMLKGVRMGIDKEDNSDSCYWEIDTRTPIYLDNFNGFWSKLEVPEEARNYGSCYVRITADSEIEFEFSDDESIELENEGLLPWIISD